MKPILISVFLFVPFALGARWLFVCETLHWCARQNLAPIPVVELKIAMPDGGMRALQVSSYQAGQTTPPRDRYSEALIDSLAKLVDTQLDYALRIEGPVLALEIDDAGSDHAYRNIGIARAAELASALQQRGVDGKRLELDTYATTEAYALVPRLSFQPIVPKAMSDGLPEGEVLVDSMAFLGLRFETNSSALQPSAEFVEYATELVAALNERPELRLSLIGHTDDQAEPGHNDSLGRWRAQAVARYLTQIGLRSPVEVSSMGERQPLAPNTTLEGRYLNRRVEARIR